MVEITCNHRGINSFECDDSTAGGVTSNVLTSKSWTFIVWFVAGASQRMRTLNSELGEKNHKKIYLRTKGDTGITGHCSPEAAPNYPALGPPSNDTGCLITVHL